MRRNREKWGLLVGLIIALIGFAMIVLPPLTEMDMMNGGYALQFVALLVIPIGLIVAWVFQKRSSVLDRMFAGEGVLAHWPFSPEESRASAAAQLIESNANNRRLFLVMTFFIVVIGLPILVIPLWDDLTRWHNTVSRLIVAGYFGLIPVLGLFAWGMPLLAYLQALEDGSEVIISSEGVYVNGALHSWKQPLTSLRGVKFNKNGRLPSLEFEIGYWTKIGVFMYQTYTVRVPVPSAQEQMAEQVIQVLARKKRS